jgi:hypothetical protein
MSQKSTPPYLAHEPCRCREITARPPRIGRRSCVPTGKWSRRIQPSPTSATWRTRSLHQSLCRLDCAGSLRTAISFSGSPRAYSTTRTCTSSTISIYVGSSSRILMDRPCLGPALRSRATYSRWLVSSLRNGRDGSPTSDRRRAFRPRPTAKQRRPPSRCSSRPHAVVTCTPAPVARGGLPRARSSPPAAPSFADAAAAERRYVGQTWRTKAGGSH